MYNVGLHSSLSLFPSTSLRRPLVRKCYLAGPWFGKIYTVFEVGLLVLKLSPFFHFFISAYKRLPVGIVQYLGSLLQGLDDGVVVRLGVVAAVEEEGVSLGSP